MLYSSGDLNFSYSSVIWIFSYTPKDTFEDRLEYIRPELKKINLYKFIHIRLEKKEKNLNLKV